jgi:Fe-S-cluster containining protein
VELAKKLPRRDVPPGACLCDYCAAKCCRYVALPLDTPKRRKDLDVFRWFLLHKDTCIFVEDGGWYLCFFTTCRELLPDNRCGVYETRPQICREYSTKDCEYDDDWTYDLFFETPDQIAEYADARFPPRGKTIRSPRPGLPMLTSIRR